MNTPAIVLVCQSHSEFQFCLDYARCLKESQARVVIAVHCAFAQTFTIQFDDMDLELVFINNFFARSHKYVRGSCFIAKAGLPESMWFRIVRYLSKKINLITGKLALLGILKVFFDAMIQELIIKEICRKENVRLIVFHTLVPGKASAAWKKVADRNNLSTLAYFKMQTLTPLSSLTALYNSRRNMAESSRMLRFYKKVRPKWFKEYKGASIARLSFFEALCSDIFVLPFMDPWNPLAEHFDLLLIESEIRYEQFRSSTNLTSEMRVVGSHEFDQMSSILERRHEERSRLFDGTGLLDDRPLILCALPPDDRFPYRVIPEYKTYEELLFSWLDIFEKVCDWNVVLSPHPRLDISRYDIRHPRVLVTTHRAFQLIPLCDLYVASVSTTSRLAKACGVPSVSFDCFYATDVDHIPNEGHFFCNTLCEFEGTLNKLCIGKELERHTAIAAKNSEKWGVLDGMSASRIVELTSSFLTH